MKQQVVSRMIAHLEQYPVPDRTTPFSFFDNKKNIAHPTGYRWEWDTLGGYLMVSVRIKPEYHHQERNCIYMMVSLADITIGGSDAGDDDIGGKDYFGPVYVVTDGTSHVRIEGLSHLLRDSLNKVPAAA